MKKERQRRHGIVIMSKLVVLLGSLAYVMLFAVVNGSLGFLSAMGITIFGSLGIAKALGAGIALSYGWIAGLTVGFGLIRGLLRFAEQYLNHFIAFRLLAVLRDKIFVALRRLCPAKLEDKKKGSIIATITADIETLEVFYAHTVSPICIAITVSLTMICILFFAISPYMALVALAGYVTIGIILPLAFSSCLKDDGVNYRRSFSLFNAFYMDSIKGIKDIVLHNASESRASDVNAKSDELLQEASRLKKKIVLATALTEVAVSLFTLTAAAVGIALYLLGAIDVGKMVVGVVTIFGSFGPVIAISALPSNLTQTFASGERVLNLVEEEPSVYPIENKDDFVFVNTEVRNLSFGYDENNKVLQDICMHAKQGEIVGIVGESGSGKSTLLKLLLRFWQKSEGEILYNGKDVESINTDCLLKNVTMVSQNTYLFDDTVKENLLIADKDATDARLDEALKQASAYNLVKSLPDGYNQQVGALGDNLSAGKRQRIGLARAFLRGSRLILLDEPTSNVDSINEGIILKSLKDSNGDKCIILVSHRESTVAIADRVYKIEDGKMTEVKQ